MLTFTSAAILIWRLYALYNRSRRILYVLLGLFLPIVALSIATDVYLYSRPSAFSGGFWLVSKNLLLSWRWTRPICVVKEIITSDVKYCTLSFNMGPMPAIYTSIPIICYDIFLVVLAAGILVKHLKERKDIKMRPNTYVILIVRYHITYFVLWVCLFPVGFVQYSYSLNPVRNLTNQVFLTMLWAGVPV